MEQRVRFEQPGGLRHHPSHTELRSRSNGPASGNKPGPSVVSGYDVHVEYSYSVAGQSYSSRRIKPRYKTIGTLPQAQAFVARYPVHAGRTCYYDPSDPSLAFLEK